MDNVFQLYGMDWGALFFGLIGCNLITQQQREGFLFSALGCICGFGAAYLSNQYGFIIYNAIVFFMMLRGYNRLAPRTSRLVALGAE